MAALQGADVRTLDDPSLLPTAAIQRPWISPVSGWISGVDADAIGRTVLVLGGNRRKTDDVIDYAGGTDDLAKIGTRVEKGQPLVTLHASSEESLAAALPYVEKAFSFSDAPVEAKPRLLERIPG